MKTAAISFAIAAGLANLQAEAACEMPTLVSSIPAGTTASEAELLAAQAAVRSYITAMDNYLACQNEELRASGSNATEEYLFQMTARIETAHAEVDAVATRFNEQVTAFRAARPASPAAPQSPFVPLQPGGAPAPQSGGATPQQPAGLTPQPGIQPPR
jgi:hypothetical protein